MTIPQRVAAVVAAIIGFVASTSLGALEFTAAGVLSWWRLGLYFIIGVAWFLFFLWAVERPHTRPRTPHRPTW